MAARTQAPAAKAILAALEAHPDGLRTGQVLARWPIDRRPATAVRLLDMADAGTIHSRRERQHGVSVEVWYAGPRPSPEPHP